jgi:predicted dehydrogenase
MSGSTPSRRDFLRTMAAAGVATVGASAVTRIVRAQSTDAPGKKLRMAFIGTGGMGGACVDEFFGLGVDCPCFCDVDQREWKKPSGHWPNAKPYQDYRKMFDEMSKEFDAVVVATPDHTHFPATVLAMKHEKHCYTQKPLTHTVWEARQLTELHKNYKYATQMGNQGRANEGCRVIYEWIKQGAIGDVTEVHNFTNRPIWPQGLDRPDGADPVPKELDWDLWLGAAPVRPFKNEVYHRFKWRGWMDFGCGALGDMGCHTQNAMFMTLDPGYPTSVEPIATMPIHKECYPTATAVKWVFPAKGDRPAFNAFWYDGNLHPARPKELEAEHNLPDTGSLFIGTKGAILVKGDYNDSPSIIPRSELERIGKPKKILDRSPGHYKEFVMAALGEKPIDFCKSNFGYAGPMTETIGLGNVALRVGRKIEWDGEKLEITNIPEANKLLTKEYREGFKFM